jgi:hypothetical protein
MIGKHETWIKTNSRLGFWLKILALIAAVFGALKETDPSKYALHPYWQSILGIVHDNAFWVIPVAAVSVVCIDWFQKYNGPPEIWCVIHHILNEMHGSVFPSDCNKAEHRVTLFRLKKNWRGAWLVPIERSHYLARKSKTRFRVQDDGNAEGVAGQAYVQKACIYVESLPNISPEFENGTHIAANITAGAFKRRFFPKECLSASQLATVQLYMRQSWTDEKKVIKNMLAGKSMPRSLCGMPVEVQGEVWGVIVIDSRNEKLIGKSKIKAFYSQNAGVLSKLIQFTE